MERPATSARTTDRQSVFHLLASRLGNAPQLRSPIPGPQAPRAFLSQLQPHAPHSLTDVCDTSATVRMIVLSQWRARTGVLITVASLLIITCCSCGSSDDKRPPESRSSTRASSRSGAERIASLHSRMRPPQPTTPIFVSLMDVSPRHSLSEGLSSCRDPDSKRPAPTGLSHLLGSTPTIQT